MALRAGARAVLCLACGAACATSAPPLPPFPGPRKETHEPAAAPSPTAPTASWTTPEGCTVELPEPRPFVGRPEPAARGYGRYRMPLARSRADECFDGVVPHEHVREGLAANRGRIRHCYSEALQRDPDTGGRVVIAFTVDKDGVVGDVEVEENETADETLAGCIGSAVRELRFLCGEEGVRVRYPVVLRALR